MTATMPTWDGFMAPVLRVLSDNGVYHKREFQENVADVVGLTEEQRRELLPSGMELKYHNRIGWALSRLVKVGALRRPRRAHYQITDEGHELLRLYPVELSARDLHELMQRPDSPLSSASQEGPASAQAAAGDDVEAELTPDERVQAGVEQNHESVAAELLTRLRGREPGFFEEAVVKLLLAMGYGGTTGAGSVTRLSNDGGIDGVIDQDVLGLSRVYIQAKRYADHNSVGRPDIQGFVGALSGKADSGVFITTSSFSDAAKTYARHVPTRVILIDGERLSALMIRYGVGVQVSATYRLVEIDEDFFA